MPPSAAAARCEHGGVPGTGQCGGIRPSPESLLERTVCCSACLRDRSLLPACKDRKRSDACDVENSGGPTNDCVLSWLLRRRAALFDFRVPATRAARPPASRQMYECRANKVLIGFVKAAGGNPSKAEQFGEGGVLG